LDHQRERRKRKEVASSSRLVPQKVTNEQKTFYVLEHAKLSSFVSVQYTEDSPKKRI
ncbi:hypothetical protein AVEN_219673-1, partial [Araneus ventricosus]